MPIKDSEHVVKGPLQKLQQLRDGYSDTIPPQIVTSMSQDNKYKVRTGWFAGVIAAIENALGEGVIKDELKSEAEQYIDDEIARLNPGTGKGHVLNTVEDINRANSLLDRILGRG